MIAGVVRVPGWERYGWLRHGFSTRAGGVSTVYGQGELNLGLTREDDPDAVRENRRRFAEAVSGEAGATMVSVRQVHGTLVKTVMAGETGQGLAEADGLMTAARGVMLGIQAADCVPVLVADTRLRIVAALHAGWRGTVAGIVEQGVRKMVADFGSAPGDLVGAIGPAIGVCCYTVGDQVREEFERAFVYARELFEETNLDLAKANRRQLLDAGLAPRAITVLGECTACSRLEGGARKYFSHRDEHGLTGRGMGMIGIAAG